MSKRTENVRYIHTFTEEERAEQYARLSDVVEEYERVEEEKKATVAEFNSKLKNLRQVRIEVNDMIRDGYEERMGTCSVTRDVRAQKVYYHLLGSGELVKERDFDGADFQMSIDDGLYDGGSEDAEDGDDDQTPYPSEE